ncbi:MAG: hypothetical protein PVG66_01425 [Chromatiales bacterium]|jgi:hypothetical protein
MSQTMITGKWIYRSYVSLPRMLIIPDKDDCESEKQCCSELKSLLFGQAVLELNETAPSVIVGTIGGTGWSLDISGSATYGNPSQLLFRGEGEIGGEPWIYDYQGYLVPAWTGGIDQRPALVGSILRVISHSDGRSPAGVVACWIAVKK